MDVSAAYAVLGLKPESTLDEAGKAFDARGIRLDPGRVKRSLRPAAESAMAEANEAWGLVRNHLATGGGPVTYEPATPRLVRAEPTTPSSEFTSPVDPQVEQTVASSTIRPEGSKRLASSSLEYPSGWYVQPSGDRMYWDGQNYTASWVNGAPVMLTIDAPQATALVPKMGEPPTQLSVEKQVLEVRGTNGTVVLDRDFLTIKRKGAYARITIGKGEKRIPVSSITAVQWKPPGPLVSGFIQFTVGGGNEKRSKFGAQTSQALHDENSVTFHILQKAEFEQLRAAVEAAIAHRHRPDTTAPSAPDYLAQLKQLADLRDAGVVSEDEFSAKKAQILSRI